jgi:riboflavin biosynthesis pyrimidine reductase
MKPYVTCHMNSSVDGRLLGSRWRPSENRMVGLFERILEELGGGSWLIGRVTGSEYAKAQAYPNQTDQTYPREPWFARRDAKAYGVALDAQGKVAWGRSDIGGDPVVAVLTEQVSDAHLAGLRQDGVSYIFGGERELDLGLVLEILYRGLRIERLLLEGGGGSNGAFLRAGLIDEISLAICPAVDGAKGAPSIFDSSDRDAGVSAPITSKIGATAVSPNSMITPLEGIPWTASGRSSNKPHRRRPLISRKSVRSRLPGGARGIRTRGPSSQGRRHLFADEKGRKSIGMAVNGSVYFVGDLRFGSRLGCRRVPFRRELRFHAGLTPLR